MVRVVVQLVVVNLFGNSLSVVAIDSMKWFHDDMTCDAQCTHGVGFRLLMAWAIWPLVLVSLAVLQEIRRRDREIRAQEQEVEGTNNFRKQCLVSRTDGGSALVATEMRSFTEEARGTRPAVWCYRTSLEHRRQRRHLPLRQHYPSLEARRRVGSTAKVELQSISVAGEEVGMLDLAKHCLCPAMKDPNLQVLELGILQHVPGLYPAALGIYRNLLQGLKAVRKLG